MIKLLTLGKGVRPFGSTTLSGQADKALARLLNQKSPLFSQDFVFWMDVYTGLTEENRV